MQGFLLEMLVEDSWRRGGETYWTYDDALKAANQILQRRFAKRIRILPVHVNLDAVADIPNESKEASA